MTAPASPPGSSDAFLELVRRTGAADPRRLDAYLERPIDRRSVHDPKTLAAGLVREGVLTEFQAKRLLAGKPEDLILGKYEVVDLLGAGTMSTVFLCRHPAMDRWVAVKLLANSRTVNPQLLKRFHREARAAATLCHPNIVHAFDFVEDDKGLFLVMEYVDGATLRAVVANHGPLSPRRAAAYTYHTAVGLQHAHESGMVHRDVKPGNIMIDRNGAVKVLDLGLTLITDESSVLTQGVLGTVDFLAPEQTIDSHKVDARADVYGLGATLYFCLTGRPPCGEGTVAQKVLAHRSRQPLPLRSFRNDVPPELEAVMLRMLAKNPDARYPSMTAVSEALSAWVREPLDPPPSHEMPQRHPTLRSTVAPAAPPPEVVLTPRPPQLPSVQAPVVPRAGLTPLPPRAPEDTPVQARRTGTGTTELDPVRTTPTALSAYSGPSRRQGDAPGLRPLVFPTLPPSQRPPSGPDATPRTSSPDMTVSPSPAPTVSRGWSTTLVVILLATALGIGVAIGIAASQLSF